MNFNDHSRLGDRHALLSASQSHWLNYDDQKLEARYYSLNAAKRGTDLHLLAHECIRMGVKQRSSKEAFCRYVNDGIKYGMTCEVRLFYSENCFGSADTVSYNNGLLRIHDYKSGITPASFRQLYVYAALFCLEYGKDPYEEAIELRIYQGVDLKIDIPEPEAIAHVMDRIVHCDEIIQRLRERDD